MNASAGALTFANPFRRPASGGHRPCTCTLPCNLEIGRYSLRCSLDRGCWILEKRESARSLARATLPRGGPRSQRSCVSVLVVDRANEQGRSNIEHVVNWMTNIASERTILVILEKATGEGFAKKSPSAHRLVYPTNCVICFASPFSTCTVQRASGTSTARKSTERRMTSTAATARPCTHFPIPICTEKSFG